MKDSVVMCNQQCLNFVERALPRRLVRGKRVLEVGAFDVNGSARTIVEPLRPAEYVGVDIVEGPGVDVTCDARDLATKFSPGAFDVVISTEMLEHVADWRRVIHNLKAVTSDGGVLILTTRSEGFPVHDYPADYWRFSCTDIRVIFADCEIDLLEEDEPTDPGVFIKARKPRGFRELDLTGYALYSMVSQERILTP